MRYPGIEALQKLTRCGARARSTGLPCRGHRMRGRARCRLHGGKSFGPPKGSQNNLKDGSWLPEVRAVRREERAAQRAAAREVAAAIAEAERLATPRKPRGRPPALNADSSRKNPPRRKKVENVGLRSLKDPDRG